MLIDLFKLDINKFKKQAINKLLPSSDSLFIARLFRSEKTPLLIIANDGYSTNRIFQELKLFAPRLNVVIFPDREVLPYEKSSPQKELVAEKLRILWQISLKQVDVVIIPANTIQTRLCPQEYLYQRVFLLKIGDKLSTTALRQKLINSDYSLVEQVFEAGEFAIRGGVIDIMPMGSRQIIRIDLFDDEIEAIKLLDSKTKELIKKIDNFELIPAREYPTDELSLKRFVAKFGSQFTEPENLSLLKELNYGMLPAGSDFYLPLFFENTATIFDYIDENWQIVYSERTLTQLNLNWQEINKRYEHFNYQYPCLKPNEVFVPSENIFAHINQHKAFILEESGELNSNITQLPDISVDNKSNNPLHKLFIWQKAFNGAIILVTDSLGRLEIMRQTLESYGAAPTVIQELNQVIPESLNIIKANLYNGFISNNFAFITEQDLYRNNSNNVIIRRRKTTQQSAIDTDAIIRDLAEIQVGDFVIHINHGIGKYLGLTTQTIADIEYEMLELEYQNESKLFIPVHNLHLISRYSKLENTSTIVNKLGSNSWQKVKTKAEKRINDIAAELLELYAKRELERGNKFILPEEYTEFVSSFGYEPTPDQETSFAAVIEDMTNQKPMDRLICGDVGFGKTEVAFRAAFIAAMNGKQVAVLTPTTLLTEQHYQNFVNRFAGFPLRIGEISRFKTKKEVLTTLELVKLGKIDILIGTHRLLQDDIKFANLGLIIIDEEHRFGVKQKEKLKQMRANVEILAMTATPIPRTLSMALDGLRDFSIIATPPRRRLAIKTIISNDDDQILREAISREIRRGGQIFFLYNDVASIPLMYERLSKLMPDIQIAIAHGQMNEHILEQTIRDFIKQRYNLLLCSTIIETGIDIANANTIIIYRADKLGLSQLHQLRGRVGRSHHQAYCYLIVPENQTRDAEKRLEAISQTAELGSGFNLALHDLEIRGAGEILGDNQSGDLKDVGLSLYTDMLKKAISRLKRSSMNSEENINDLYCEVNLNTTCILPDEYCPDIHERLVYYKRLGKANSIDEIDLVYQDIMDNWGLAPIQVKDLIYSHYLRVKAITLGLQKLDVTDKAIILTFIDKPPLEPIKIILLMQKLHTCKYDGKNKLIWTKISTNTSDKIKQANYILDELLA